MPVGAMRGHGLLECAPIAGSFRTRASWRECGAYHETPNTPTRISTAAFIGGVVERAARDDRAPSSAEQYSPALLPPLDPLLRAAAHRRSSRRRGTEDRKSTRLNSSHGSISYAVFCLKKKKNNI